jgi:hypothetical protein
MNGGNHWDAATLLGDAAEQTILRVGSELGEIEPTAGFRALMALLKQEHDAAGQRFIKDETTSKKYARGYLAGLSFLLEEIPEMIRKAREIKESREETGQFFDSRIGGAGSGSLA